LEVGVPTIYLNVAVMLAAWFSRRSIGCPPKARSTSGFPVRGFHVVHARPMPEGRPAKVGDESEAVDSGASGKDRSPPFSDLRTVR